MKSSLLVKNNKNVSNNIQSRKIVYTLHGSLLSNYFLEAKIVNSNYLLLKK